MEGKGPMVAGLPWSCPRKALNSQKEVVFFLGHRRSRMGMHLVMWGVLYSFLFPPFCSNTQMQCAIFSHLENCARSDVYFTSLQLWSGSILSAFSPSGLILLLLLLLACCIRWEVISECHFGTLLYPWHCNFLVKWCGQWCSRIAGVGLCYIEKGYQLIGYWLPVLGLIVRCMLFSVSLCIWSLSCSLFNNIPHYRVLLPMLFAMLHFTFLPYASHHLFLRIPCTSSHHSLFWRVVPTANCALGI